MIDFKDLGLDLRDVPRKEGPDIELREVAMKFDYDSAFERRELEGYERLVHDAMLGDQTLFTRGDGIERLWQVSEPLLEDPPKLELYEPESGARVGGGAHLAADVAPLLRAGSLMSDRAWQVIVTAGVGLALLVVLRIVLGVVFERMVSRAAKKKSPDYVARPARASSCCGA